MIGLAAKPPFHAAPRIGEADFGSWLTSVPAAHRDRLYPGRSNSQSRRPADLPEWRRRTLFFGDPEDNVVEIYAEY